MAAEVRLVCASGKELRLRSGESVVLGREHAVGEDRAFVGREQASVLFYDGAVVLTSISRTNATYVFRAGKSRAIKCCADETCHLEQGDSIGLVGKAQLVTVQLLTHAGELVGSAGDGALPVGAADRKAALVCTPREASGRAMDEPSAGVPSSGPMTKRARVIDLDEVEACPPSSAGETQPEARDEGLPTLPPSEPPAEPAPEVVLHSLRSFAPLAMRWAVHAGELLVGTPLPTGACAPPSALAVFDLDHTLLSWTSSGFPRSVADYAVPSVVVSTVRRLHAQGHALAVLANNAAVKGAFGGALATRCKEVIERLAAALAPAPLIALIATRKPSRFRRPQAGMFHHLLTLLPQRARPARVLCVGTAPQQPLADGSDDGRAFAAALGAGVFFRSAEECFGFETHAGGGWREWAQPRPDAPARAGGPHARAAAHGELCLLGALHGGHANGPVLLLLCGPPGSGKSTFCAALLRARAEAADACLSEWVVACQDTASADGTGPGPRAKVERAAAEALARGQSVVVDRTNLTKEQRAHFSAIGRAAGAPVLACCLTTPLATCEARVRARSGHPGGVEGAGGVAVVRRLAASLELPDAAAEDIDAAFCCATEHAAAAARLFAGGVLRVGADVPSERAARNGTQPHVPAGGVARGEAVEVPPFGWGTFELAASSVPAALGAARAASAGRPSVLIDCASTYGNEKAVGAALRAWRAAGSSAAAPFVCAKLARSVCEADQVGPALAKSLDALGTARADMVLLHWPCAVMEAGTLAPVWASMRRLLEGPAPLCRSLGVCNFTAEALEQLPSLPAAVQVERHPLLPQWELQLFCSLRGIALIAHMPLGGRLGCAQLLAHPTVVRVARECGRSPAQVLLRWNLQHGCAVITRAGAAHARENGDLSFTLSAAHMRLLDGMSKPSQTRFLSTAQVPFMRAPGASYSW